MHVTYTLKTTLKLHHRSHTFSYNLNTHLNILKGLQLMNAHHKYAQDAEDCGKCYIFLK